MFFLARVCILLISLGCVWGRGNSLHTPRMGSTASRFPEPGAQQELLDRLRVKPALGPPSLDWVMVLLELDLVELEIYQVSIILISSVICVAHLPSGAPGHSSSPEPGEVHHKVLDLPQQKPAQTLDKGGFQGLDNFFNCILSLLPLNPIAISMACEDGVSLLCTLCW